MPDFQTPIPQRRPQQRPPQRPQDLQGRPDRDRPERGRNGHGNQARAEGLGTEQGRGTGGDMDAMVRETQQLATDVSRQGTMDATLKEFDSIKLTVPLKTKAGVDLTASVTIETPYRINHTSTDYAVGHKSYPSSRLPSSDAKDAPAGLKAATTNAKLGKGSPSEIQMVLQAAIDQGKITFPVIDDKLLGKDGKLDAKGGASIEARIQTYLQAGKGRLVGVDCSGFIYQIVTRMSATAKNPDPKWMGGILNTGTSTLKSSKELTTIKSASTLRPGDLLLYARHVEMVRDSTQMSEADAKKLSGVTVPKGSQVYELGVMESSPGGDREGPSTSEWVVVQSPKRLIFYKKSGTSYVEKAVKARRPDALGDVPRSDTENAPGQKPKR